MPSELRTLSPGSYLVGSAPGRLAPAGITCYAGSSISAREAERLSCGRGSAEGRGGQAEITDVGRGGSPEASTWFQGKGCFVSFGLKVQGQDRKCARGLGAQGASPRPPFRGSFLGSPNCCPVWKAKLRLNPGAFPALRFPPALFFFSLMDRQLRS